MLKPSSTNLFATFGIFAALVGGASGGTIWVFDHFDLKEKLGVVSYLWLVFCTGVLGPSVVLLLWWLVHALRDAEQSERLLVEARVQCDDFQQRARVLEQANAELKSELGDARRVAMVGVAAGRVHCDELVIHLLDECLINVQLISMEMHGEHGPHFTKAKDQHARTLTFFERLCRSRYTRDKQLLQRIAAADNSGARQKFVQLKELLLGVCSKAHRELSTRAINNDEAQRHIDLAADSLAGFAKTLDQEIYALTNELSRHQR